MGVAHIDWNTAAEILRSRYKSVGISEKECSVNPLNTVHLESDLYFEATLIRR